MTILILTLSTLTESYYKFKYHLNHAVPANESINMYILSEYVIFNKHTVGRR